MSFSDPRAPCSCSCSEYECPYCPEFVFPNSHALIKHLRKSGTHREQKEAFWCPLCGESFLSIIGYIDHLQQKRIHKYDLHQAACCGRFQDVGQMIHTEDAGVTGASHKVKPVASLQHLGKTPLHCAAFAGYSRCLKVMLSWPDINANIPDDLGQTPVHLAAMCGRGSSLRLLLDKGGDLGILDKNGKSPIQLANGDDDSMNVILMHQFSAMISHYHLKGVKAQIARSISVEERRITEADKDDSGSASSVSEDEDNSKNNDPSSKPDEKTEDETEVGAVYTEKISNSSSFAAILAAFNISSDSASQKILCTEVMVQSGHDEKTSEIVGHMTEVCAVVNDGDKTRKDTLAANTTITGSQDVDNVSTAGNLTISFGSEDDDETRQKFAGTNTIIPKRQDIQNICKGTAKKGVK